MSEPLPIPPPTKRRRSNPIKLLIAAVAIGVMLLVLAAVRVNNFLRRKVSIGDVKFPVLILQPNGMAAFAEWDSTNLYKFHEKSPRSPVEDTIIIDAEFNVYQQKNVKYASSDLGWLARRYLTPNLRVKYTFDLYRVKKANRDEAISRVLAHPKLTNIEDLNAADLRQAIAAEPTLPGVLDVLRLFKPIDPAPPTTEPATIEVAPVPDDAEAPEPKPWER